ncbi:MAG: hypothetical protein IKI97_03590 [Clostridia bacterium]|nr:hypothetical protein [Clostridia bacterium]
MDKTNIKDNYCNIYLVLTQTGTILSKLLKHITHANYNHSSISLHEDLSTMYSFGRLNPYNAFHGGFVKESVDKGVFGRFPNTSTAVIKISIPKDKYDSLSDKLSDMYNNRKQYHYNTLGLCSALFKCNFKRKNGYYCSEFISRLLVEFGIVPARSFNKIVKPIDFYKLFEKQVIYEGLLRKYNKGR